MSDHRDEESGQEQDSRPDSSQYQPPRPLSSAEAVAYRRQVDHQRVGDRGRARPGPPPLRADTRAAGHPSPSAGRQTPPRAAWMLGLAALIGCLVLGLSFVAGDDGDTTDTGTLPPIAASSVPEATTAADQQSPTTSDPTGAPADGGVANTLLGEVTGSQIRVTGEVPSTQAAASLRLLLEQVAGLGNVNTDAVTVNAAAVAPTSIDMIVDSELVFPSGSSDIQAEFLETLDRIAALMVANASVTAVVEGHADSLGDKAVNLSLSQRRADAVVAHLEGKGIDSTRLTPVGKGSTEPLGDNATPEGRRQNRRIEFSLGGFRLDL